MTRPTFGPPPDCVHLDNHRRCRLHHAWQQMFVRAYRPPCLLDRTDRPPDGEWECPDQCRRPPPSPPFGRLESYQ